MIRYILFMGFVLAALQTPAQKNTLTLTSKIEKVTVFRNGAQVERLASQQLQPGKYTLVFTGLSSRLEEQSIQFKPEGRVIVHSVTRQQNFISQLQVNDQIKSLEKQMEEWQEKISHENNLKRVLDEEEQLLLKNQQIKGESATLKAAEIKEVADFQRARLTSLYKERNEVLLRKKALDNSLSQVQQQLNALHQKKDLSTSDIHVAVEIKEAGSQKFWLSYLVKEAKWQAAYDIRVSSITQPLTLQMKAIISQHSGEDWQDVKMALSSGDPNQNGEKPILTPWPLRFTLPEPLGIRIRGASSLTAGSTGMVTVTGVVSSPDGLPISYASVIVKGTTMGVTTDAQGAFSINVPSSASQLSISSIGYTGSDIPVRPGFNRVILPPVSGSELSEVVVTGLGIRKEDDDSYFFNSSSYNTARNNKRQQAAAILTSVNYQPTTTVFSIDAPFTVPSDSQQYRAHIQDWDVNALYEYYAVPKLDDFAYLTAKVIGWQELNLLSGEASLFFEGNFLGNSWLDLNNAGDTLQLSLGQDKGIQIKRTLLKENSSKKLLGSNRTDSRQYEITVRNNKQSPVSITIEDQYPISTTKEIEVDKTGDKTGKIDDDSQLITWQLRLEPRKESSVRFGYSVKYPKNKIVRID